MFIDGLDEFDGPYDSVIKTITELSDQRHVKICVSSRPLLTFEMAFKGEPSLKLQDLNFDTIRDYVYKQLSHSTQQFASSNRKTQQRLENLLQMIVLRADAVFLWAVIATREVRDGLQGMVNLDELAQAIEVLPPELEALFMLVLKRIKLAFRRDAAKFLQFVLFTKDMEEFHDMQNLDLCRLYLISSQQDFQDAPFVHDILAMDELTEACRTLETRLLSHTAGLLELTSQTRSHESYCKRKDWDPISFTKVEFLHRTVRDFLLDKNEAKSFLNDYGLSEAQVHLCIAKGTLAHLALHSQGDTVTDEDWPHPMLNPFKDVLRHVSMAERLSGSAQSKFIQSLDYASLVRGYTVPGSRDRFCWYEPYWKNTNGSLVDIVGMAAAVGMTIYVCERLGLPVSSTRYYSNLPDLEKYSTSRATRAYLSWEKVDQSTHIFSRADTLFCPSVYRQALSKCLQWEDDNPANSRLDVQTANHSSVENYILCCCEPTSIDLVRILLKTGVNPMVRVRLKEPRFPWRSEPFWESWLLFLHDLRHNHMVANGKSGGLFCSRRHLDRLVTLSDVLDVTKALLANGTDINYQLEDGYLHEYFLKRPDLSDNRFGLKLELSATAMFILEECFNNEPEFQEFAVAVSPLIKRPTRDIVKMLVREEIGIYAVYDISANDSKVLWPMIEKWERSGHDKDLTALVTAIKRICNARNHSKESKEESVDEAEEESDEASELEFEA